MRDLDPRALRHAYPVPGVGAAEAWVADGVVVAHELMDARGAHAPGAGLSAGAGFAPQGGESSPGATLPADVSRESARLVEDLCRRVHRHLEGRPTTYDDLPLDDGWCTPYQSELLAALRSVPWGEVVTYGELAALAGRPRAARAAGSFCAGNRFWLIAPCHRVIASDGIGAYGASGVSVKRRLLELEGVRL